jgi:hypothetical protein
MNTYLYNRNDMNKTKQKKGHFYSRAFYWLAVLVNLRFPQVFLLRKTGSKTWPSLRFARDGTTQAFLAYTWEKVTTI